MAFINQQTSLGAAPSIRILEWMCNTAREIEAATLTLKVQERTG